MLFNAITAVIASELFETGLAVALKVLCATWQSRKAALISQWPFMFSGLELIVNQITLGHHDAGGALSHYNLLGSLGIEHNTIFCIRDLEAELNYVPETLL